MHYIMLKSKLHRAAVTAVEPEYEGSLTLDPELMEAVKLVPYEKVLVANLANGERLETYVIAGERGTGTVCLNGAAAHRGAVGDRIIVFAFCALPASEVPAHHPLVLVLDDANHPCGPLREP
jgi:aspartate 1-decarboxylase